MNEPENTLRHIPQSRSTAGLADTGGNMETEVCGHFGIGSATDCKIGDWLSLQPNAAVKPTPLRGAA